jgi:hypothetical protein
MRQKIRVLHYSIRTEKTYVDWVRRFILFHGEGHSAQMDGAEVEAFLTYLAVQRKVSASTQNQAKSANKNFSTDWVTKLGYELSSCSCSIKRVACSFQ